MRHTNQRAFTLIEILTVVGILGILAGLVVVGLGSWQRAQATTAVKSDVRQAVSGLASYKNFKNNYPPNLAGTGFAASKDVALKLTTNAPSVGVYEGLTGDQNAQLFLNACNANLFATPNNTACSFQGNGGGAKIHAKGTSGSNTIWNSPVGQSDLTLNCGSEQEACNQAIASMISQFSAQGGEFPIIVPGNTVPLPEPTQVPNGPANRYCLEGRASDFPDIVFYALSSSTTITAGECPNDPTLHYYQ
jgi:general secretion pathway protein G